MIEWNERPREERNLLNPGFCSLLLWQAARAHTELDGRLLAFEESFLILPFTLDKALRESIPNTARTSLIIWLDEDPLRRGQITARSQLLVEHTKEALLLAGAHGIISIHHGGIEASPEWLRKINKIQKSSSDEVRQAAKKAAFLGRWFANTGNATTVMSLIGVRP